eukprot:m.194738 g.194738  ORF g.194738 m.194738 type:complete len:93 (-) comp18660_c0_seq2:352-630(-)
MDRWMDDGCIAWFSHLFVHCLLFALFDALPVKFVLTHLLFVCFGLDARRLRDYLLFSGAANPLKVYVFIISGAAAFMVIGNRVCAFAASFLG